MPESKPAFKERLVAAIKEMEAPKRTATNPHFGSKFAPLEEVLRVINAALHKHDLVFVQPTITLGDQIGVDNLVMAADDEVSLGSLLMPMDSDPQKQGAKLTYIRRYAACAAFGLAADDDLDGNDAVPQQTPHAPQGRAYGTGFASDKQVNMAFALSKKLGWPDDKLMATVKKNFGKEHPGDLTGGREGEASKLIDFLSDKLKEGETEKVAEGLGAEVLDGADNPL